jgi:hypothetical protein
LFASGDGGGRWAAVASLIETCKMNGVDPQRYFSDVLTRLVNSWPQSRIDELMPWHWAAARSGCSSSGPEKGPKAPLTSNPVTGSKNAPRRAPEWAFFCARPAPQHVLQ